jgi:hypothetical protein
VTGAPFQDGPAGETRPAHRRAPAKIGGLEPVGGVTLELYATVSHGLAGHGYDPERLPDVAHELGIPPELWKVADREWSRRIVGDPEVAAEFGRIYRAARTVAQ